MIKRLAIIGVGLIGGSLARALRRVNYCEEIVGYSRCSDHIKKALELGVIDRYEKDIARTVRGADMVVIGVPLGAVESVFRAMANDITPLTIITDVGSAKASVVNAASQVFDTVPANFVPGHPIAGTEKRGVESSYAELFECRRVILTPLENTSLEAVAQVRHMWEQTGAIVDTMNADHHDEVLAATSHLPHLLAYALVDTLVSMDESEDVFRFAAGGFRDFTRIASSDPTMWHDICISNRQALLTVLERFLADLTVLKDAVSDNDGEKLKTVFTRAKTVRDRFCMGGNASE